MASWNSSSRVRRKGDLAPISATSSTVYVPHMVKRQAAPASSTTSGDTAPRTPREPPPPTADDARTAFNGFCQERSALVVKLEECFQDLQHRVEEWKTMTVDFLARHEVATQDLRKQIEDEKKAVAELEAKFESNLNDIISLTTEKKILEARMVDIDADGRPNQTELEHLEALLAEAHTQLRLAEKPIEILTDELEHVTKSNRYWRFRMEEAQEYAQEAQDETTKLTHELEAVNREQEALGAKKAALQRELLELRVQAGQPVPVGSPAFLARKNPTLPRISASSSSPTADENTGQSATDPLRPRILTNPDAMRLRTAKVPGRRQSVAHTGSSGSMTFSSPLRQRTPPAIRSNFPTQPDEAQPQPVPHRMPGRRVISGEYNR